MSDLNLEWANTNLSRLSDPVIFDIGCARLDGDSLRFRMAVPTARVISFECSQHWKTINEQSAQCYDMEYHHVAVSDHDGTATFWPSRYRVVPADQAIPNKESWNFAGTLGNISKFQYNIDCWGDSYQVPCITLNTFCESNLVKPNLMHVDAETFEYRIMNSIDDRFLPEIAWLEYRETGYDAPGSQGKMSYQDLVSMMLERGYGLHYEDVGDSLFVLESFSVTPYESFDYYKKPNQTMPLSERKLLEKIWLFRYHCCKDANWPTIESAQQFFSLPLWIQQECAQVFDLVPAGYLLDH